jgi:hypothetical protein
MSLHKIKKPVFSKEKNSNHCIKCIPTPFVGELTEGDKM